MLGLARARPNLQTIAQARYRLRMLPKVPRTMARPIELPVLPPTDFPISAAIWPAVLEVTLRAMSRATRWPVESRFRPVLVPNMSPSQRRVVAQNPSADEAFSLSAPAGGAAVEPVSCIRFCRTSYADSESIA